jgi:hypothetical protein
MSIDIDINLTDEEARISFYNEAKLILNELRLFFDAVESDLDDEYRLIQIRGAMGAISVMRCFDNLENVMDEIKNEFYSHGFISKTTVLN